MEPHQEVVITLSKGGYVKEYYQVLTELNTEVEKVLRRMTKDGDDIVPYIQVADTHDTLLFFTDKGRVFFKGI